MRQYLPSFWCAIFAMMELAVNHFGSGAVKSFAFFAFGAICLAIAAFLLRREQGGVGVVSLSEIGQQVSNTASWMQIAFLSAMSAAALAIPLAVSRWVVVPLTALLLLARFVGRSFPSNGQDKH